MTFFPADSPANPSAQQESDRAKMMTVSSGRKCFEQFGKYSPLGSLAKMLLESSAWRMAEHLTEYSLTWKAKAMRSKRFLFQLQQRGASTKGNGSGLLPTTRASEGMVNKLRRPENIKDVSRLEDYIAMLPTPYATMEEKYKLKEGSQACDRNLSSMARRGLLPTPTLQEHKNDTLPASQADRDNLAGWAIRENYSGQLSVRFVEQMMGFPLNWTDVSASMPWEMQSFGRWHIRFSLRLMRLSRATPTSRNTTNPRTSSAG